MFNVAVLGPRTRSSPLLTDDLGRGLTDEVDGSDGVRKLKVRLQPHAGDQPARPLALVSVSLFLFLTVNGCCYCLAHLSA